MEVALYISQTEFDLNSLKNSISKMSEDEQHVIAADIDSYRIKMTEAHNQLRLIRFDLANPQLQKSCALQEFILLSVKKKQRRLLALLRLAKRSYDKV